MHAIDGMACLKTLDAFSFDAQPDLDRDAVLQVRGVGRLRA